MYLQCTLRQPVLTVQRNLQFGLVELVCNVQLSLIILVHNVNCAFFVYKCTIYNAEESILQSTAMKKNAFSEESCKQLIIVHVHVSFGKAPRLTEQCRLQCYSQKFTKGYHQFCLL